MTGGPDRTDQFGLGAASGEEVVAVPWTVLLRGRLAGSDRHRWFVLWTVMGGLFAVNVTFTIFAIALPRVSRELGTTENTLTWVITAPLLAFGALAPLAGKAGDVWGHKRLYLMGMAGAAVAAALSVVAWNAGSLIAFRVLGSVEGAATGAASMAMVFKAFDAGDRVKAMGWWSLVGAGGPVLGVAVGGPVIEIFGWRAIFAAQVPMVLVALAVAVVVLPSDPARGARRSFDTAGVFWLTVAAGSLLVAMNRGPEWGWTSPAVIVGFLLTPVAAAAFLRTEARADDPVVPLDYLRRRNFVAPIAVSMGTNFAYMGGFILTPQLLTDRFGYGEGRIGAVVLTRPLTFSLMSPTAGYLTLRIGERAACVAGSLLVVGSMVAFAGVGGLGLVFAGLVLSGVGVGFSSPASSSTLANAVSADDLGSASAAHQLMTHVGLVAGIQLMKTVQAEAGYSWAFAVGALGAVAAVAAALLVRSAER